MNRYDEELRSLAEDPIDSVFFYDDKIEFDISLIVSFVFMLFLLVVVGLIKKN